MRKTGIVIAAAVLFGCCEVTETTDTETELGTAELEALVPGESFGFRVTERKELVQDVLQRWERATCMRLAITDDGPHTIRFKERVATGGGIHGTWEAAVIDIQTANWRDSQVKVVVTHELGHLLARTNEHVDNSVLAGEWQFDRRNRVISSALLARVCSVRDCGCFSPEG